MTGAHDVHRKKERGRETPLVHTRWSGPPKEKRQKVDQIDFAIEFHQWAKREGGGQRRD